MTIVFYKHVSPAHAYIANDKQEFMLKCRRSFGFWSLSFLTIIMAYSGPQVE